MTQPKGELVIKTIAMPKDTNRYGDMFGGWLASQLDLGGGVLAHKCSHTRMTTVAIDRMVFIRPVYVGDLVCCYANIVKRGNTSVGIAMEAWVESSSTQNMQKVTEGVFTYVAIDKNGRPTPIQWQI